MTPDLGYIEKWEPEISLKYKNGSPAINLGLVITLYFKDGHLPAARRNMIECATRFRREFGELPLFMGEDWLAYSERSFNREAARRLKCAEEEQCYWGLTSAEGKYLAPDFSIWFSSPRIFQNEVSRSVIKLTFPLSYLKQPAGGDRFQGWIRHLCDSFSVECGFAGLAFVLPDVLPFELEHLFPYEYERAVRFPGVLVDSIGRFEDDAATRGIKSAGWYTLLGKSVAEKLGGPDHIESVASATPSIEILTFSETAVLKAGALPPSLGETNCEELPTALVKVNELISPVRLKEIGSLHLYAPGEHPQFDELTSRQWLSRFDRAI